MRLDRCNWPKPAARAAKARPRLRARGYRGGYDAAGSLISKEIVQRRHQPGRRTRRARTSREPPAANGHRIGALAGRHRIPRRLQYRTYREWRADPSHLPDSLAISLLHLAGVPEITLTLQALGRGRAGVLSHLQL